jgi:hypothetical protein
LPPSSLFPANQHLLRGSQRVRRGGDCPSPGRCRVRRLLLFEQGLRRRLPARSRDARARVWRHRSVGCEGHAPVVAVLLASAERKVDESILAPLGRAAPQAVIPANRAFLGCRNGCHDLDDGTPSCGSRGCAGGTLDWWPKGRPVVAVLSYRVLSAPSSGVRNHAELAEAPPRAVRDRLAGADPLRR